MLTTVFIFQLLTTIAVFATGDTGGTPYNASRVKAPSISATPATPAPTRSIWKCRDAIQMCRAKMAKQDQCPNDGGEGCLTVRQFFAEYQCEGLVMDDHSCEPAIEKVFSTEYIVHTQQLAACSRIAAERQLCQPEFDQAAFYMFNGIYVNLGAAERCLVSHLQMKPYQHNSEAQFCIAGVTGSDGPFEQNPEPMVAPAPSSDDGSLTAPSLSEGSLAAPSLSEDSLAVPSSYCLGIYSPCFAWVHSSSNSECCAGMVCKGIPLLWSCQWDLPTRYELSEALPEDEATPVEAERSPVGRFFAGLAQVRRGDRVCFEGLVAKLSKTSCSTISNVMRKVSCARDYVESEFVNLAVDVCEYIGDGHFATMMQNHRFPDPDDLNAGGSESS